MKVTVMTASRVVRLAAVAASMALSSQHAADAQDAGSFRFLESGVHGYATIGHAGGTVTGGPLVGTFTVVEGSDPPFVEGETGVLRCVVHVRASRDGVVELEAPCAVTDGAGDEMYLLARRKEGDVAEGGGGTGRYEIMGGTGRYAGVSGECPYETRYLPGNHVVVSGTCTWRKP